MIILGIDPGYERLGISIIEMSQNQKNTLLYSSCFTTDPKSELPQRFYEISTEINRIIIIYSPQELSIEKLFWGKNHKTAMKVSEVRGIIINEAKKSGLDIFEYTPSEIKIAITGYGRSTKSQVFHILKQLIHIPKKTTRVVDDEYDAIAIALTHSVSSTYIKKHRQLSTD